MKHDSTRKPPSSLGKIGKSYWRTIHSTFVVEEADLELLIGLCSMLDRLAAIRDELRKSGIVVNGRFGPAPSKLLAEERQTLLCACKTWRELGFSSDQATSPTIPTMRGYK